MARLKRELAEIDYMAGMKYKDIAEKYGVSLNTVKSWKKRYGWHREKGCTQIKRVHKNCISQIGNRNATGPPGNRNAEKYGFYSKFLPEDTKEIVFHDEDPLDVLWVQIRFAHAALIRAQQIAYVESQKDKTVDVISTTTGDAIESTTLAIQQAWDKQENFMKAQSHAQATLVSQKQAPAVYPSLLLEPDREVWSSRFVSKLKVSASSSRTLFSASRIRRSSSSS